jgi:putative transcriptional regulator
MTISHHPSDETMLAHGNGSLGPVLSLVVGVHLDGCGFCRETFGLTQALGGALLDSVSPVAMSPVALARILDRLDSPPAKNQRHPEPPAGLDLPPALKGQAIGPRRWLAPGVWTRSLMKDRATGTRAYLLGAAAGKALPSHGHHGVELTQVLEGAFFDGEIRYGAGDLLEAGGRDEHRPVVSPGDRCVCLIASQGLPRGAVGLLMRVLT